MLLEDKVFIHSRRKTYQDFLHVDAFFLCYRMDCATVNLVCKRGLALRASPVGATRKEGKRLFTQNQIANDIEWASLRYSGKVFLSAALEVGPPRRPCVLSTSNTAAGASSQ